jgi:ribose 5-phosphate isomerase RpiB
VEENDVNLLCLPGNTINSTTAKELIQLFLDSRFVGKKEIPVD